MSKEIFISIIMPVYNAEETLRISLDSLLNQAVTNVQLVIINDASSDNTDKIIINYASDFEDKGWEFKYIVHSINLGVANARNSGLDQARGDYIYYVDADDYLQDSALSCMLSEAKLNDLDILGFNWYLSFSKNARLMRQPEYSDNNTAIEYMLKGVMRWNLWIFLVKRSLYEENNIRFLPNKNMGEDLLMTVKLFTAARKVKTINKALYYYAQSNQQSLTKVYSQQHMQEINDNIYELEKFLVNNSNIEGVKTLIMFLKLNIKLPLLVSGRFENYKLWQSWFSESNSYISQNKAQALRTRLLQSMALRNQYWFVKVYYLFVFKFVYGVLYN